MLVSASDSSDSSSFKDAVATIRRTGVEYQYQLVVTRAYEEGEEQLLDDDAECELNHIPLRLATDLE